jgi:hypothetical protein
MNGLKRKGVILGIMFAFGMTILTVGQLFAPYEGCTPGFWKRLAKDGDTGWLALTMFYALPTGYSPSDTLREVLTFGTQIQEQWWLDIQEMTMLDALKFHGGDGVEGGVRIFLRAAVAGLLNAAAWENQMINYWNWPYFKQVIVEGLLANGTTRDDFIGMASSIDYWNNLGCPTNRWGVRMWPWPSN